MTGPGTSTTSQPERHSRHILRYFDGSHAGHPGPTRITLSRASRGILDPALFSLYMQIRGTKRPAEAGEIEFGLEPVLNGDGLEGRTGMLSTFTEAVQSGADAMAGILAHTRRFWPFYERTNAGTDDSNVGVKRVKLSEDGQTDRELGSRSQGYTTHSMHANQPYQLSAANGQGPVYPDQEACTGNPDESTFLPGSFSVANCGNDAPTTMLAMPTKDGEKRPAKSSLGQQQAGQSTPARRLALARLKDPFKRAQVFEQFWKSKGAMRSFHMLNPACEQRPNYNNNTEMQSLPEASRHSGNEVINEDDDPAECHDRDETSHRGPLRALATLGDLEAVSDTLEAFEGLRISGLVAERQRQEREAREREEELERQRKEEERARLAEEERAREEERLREEAERQGRLRRPNRDLFPPLNAEWSEKVQRSLRSPGDLAATPETKLRNHDFGRLVPSTQWLNDNCVNGSLLWLDRFINETAGITDVKSQTRKCLMPGSFFFTRLLDHGVKGTERTLRRLGVNKDNILDIETILMPICQADHWTLIVVEPRKRAISHFDSLNPAGSDGKRSLAKDWIKALLGDLFIEEEWRFVKYVAPRQTNGWDCGVHTVLNGLCLGLGIDPSSAYNSEQLPELRRKLAAMLLNEGFKGEFDLAGC